MCHGSDTVPNHRTLLLNEIKTIPGVKMASRGFLRLPMKALLLQI